PSRYDATEGVEVRQGDLLEPESLEGVFEDIDVVYYLVHSMQSGGDFAERDKKAAHNFVEAVKDTNVERVIYLGGLGETRDNLSEHLSSRREIEEVLREGDYELTSFRAAVIVGAGSASFEIVRQLVNRLPVMITPQSLRTPCQPIAISDVVTYLVECLDVPETAGKTFEIGVPDVLTYQKMLKRTARVMGKKRFIIPVPILTPALSTYWIDLATDVPKSIVHPLIYGLKNPVVVKDESVNDYFDFELTSFDVAVERALRKVKDEA
ncbi:MAG: NAD(P)H-binding protein, partial [Halobacteria archaeon]|nr:NAD(P)H-binding protein [Halobacteria archaeon]